MSQEGKNAALRREMARMRQPLASLTTSTVRASVLSKETIAGVISGPLVLLLPSERIERISFYVVGAALVLLAAAVLVFTYALPADIQARVGESWFLEFLMPRVH